MKEENRRLLILAIGVVGLVPISIKAGILGSFPWLICIGLALIFNRGDQF